MPAPTKSLVALWFITLTSIPCAVLAQAAGEQAQRTEALQDIVVTAQRVFENAQNVPVALTALDANELRQCIHATALSRRAKISA